MDSSVLLEDSDSSRDSNISLNGSCSTQCEDKIEEQNMGRNINVVNKILNRQIYGRFTKNPKSKTERIYEGIPEKCNRLLSDVLPAWDTSIMQHIFMGFTICGQYVLSYTWTTEEDLQSAEMYSFIYYLHVWRYAPGHRLNMVCKQKIFRNSKPQELLDISFSQWPTDRNKIVAFGISNSEYYVTIFFLPSSQKCDDCVRNKTDYDSDLAEQFPCLQHSITIDIMLSITTPYPIIKPDIHLAFPDHIVVNTGHHIHIINVSYVNVIPQAAANTFTLNLDRDKQQPPSYNNNNNNNNNNSNSNNQCFSDSISDISETHSEFDYATTKTPNTNTNIIEAIIQDFSEYDLEGNECSKPFHELNISCEPLNVTGKSYFNTHNNDSRYKTFVNAHSSRDQRPQILQTEKSKIDKNIAEKAYEFTEDTEKCEKLSSFRKKRLADKKYEFSEDNSENIIPFQLLRQERRFLLRSQNRLIRSPDYFVSPGARQGIRSPRSPMLSPTTNRTAVHSPSCSSSPRNCPSIRPSPGGTCRSPISPRDSARKFNVYSPSHFDSDCSDNDSKLVLRQINNVAASRTTPLDFTTETRSLLCNNAAGGGLLIVDGGKRIEEKPRWIRKVIKRYCNLDFESTSLISDVQSRDEYLCIDLPILVHTANNSQIDIVPSRVNDELIGPHIKITQKTFDSEQFCQRRAEKLCAENRLKFTHCEDYDIKIQHICPLSGDIICTAEIKIGALKDQQNTMELSQAYIANCLFVWNICTDSYRIIEPDNSLISTRLVVARHRNVYLKGMVLDKIPEVHCKKVRHMTHDIGKSLQFLRDTDNYIQISLDNVNCFYIDSDYSDSYQYSDDEDSNIDV